MVRQRARIRFRKQGNLRLIGHQDLLRAWERLFRRAGVCMRMSEGFHPRPRLNLPGALALGVAGLDEVIEVEFESAVDERSTQSDELLRTLQPQCPEGLTIDRVELIPLDQPLAEPSHMTLELPIPLTRRAALAARIAEVLARSSLVVEREGGRRPLDLRPLVDQLQLDDGVLRVRLRVSREGSVRPRELLAALGLDGLDSQEHYWTRTAVELRS